MSVREIVSAWNNRGYKIEFWGDEPLTVVLGEKHGDDESVREQIELIQALNPKVVLHELLAGGLIYDPTTGRFEPQQGRHLDETDMDPRWALVDVPKDLITASKDPDFGFKIVGCDLTEAEFNIAAKQIALQAPGEYEYDEEAQLLIRLDDPEWDLTNLSPEMMPFRDRQMADMYM